LVTEEENILESTNEILENTEEITENTEEEINEYTEGEYTTELEVMQQIHYDLGIICCFLIFFTIVIILKNIYKFFNIIFTF